VGLIPGQAELGAEGEIAESSAELAMSYMFEVIYRAPADAGMERQVESIVVGNGGRLDCREDPEPTGPNSVVLTYEFGDYDAAFATATRLRELGYKVDGPYDYGD
jgi:hypothetical protein